MNHNFYPNAFYFNFNNPVANRMRIVQNGNGSVIHGRRQLFSYEEDEQLKRLVEKFGDKDWKFIAKRMPGRSTRQCRERYKNYLSPEIKNGPWTKEEDDLLKEKYSEYGPRWSVISKFFKSRSDVNVKNRWSALSFHMNNDNNNNKNAPCLFYPHPVQKKTKVLYPPTHNFCYQEANSLYPRSGFSIAPQNIYSSNMNQMLNCPQHQSHIISNQSFTNISTSNSEISNGDENETQNEDEDDASDESLPVPINQTPKQQNNEIKNIINDTTNVAVQSNPDSPSISLSTVPLPMSVNFSGPLPPLLQKPKILLHFQQQQQPSSTVSNSTVESPNELSQRRNINSPLTINQLNPNSPLSFDNNHLRSSLTSQQEELKIQRSLPQVQSPHSEKDEERIHPLQQHSQQYKEEITNPNTTTTNSYVRIIQKLDTTSSNNFQAQISSSSVQSSNSNISPSPSATSSQLLTIHKPQNQQHNQIKQTTISTNPVTSESNLNSNFLINFPFPQSLLSNSLLAPNEQQESILSTDARIDDASINTETEVLTNTFPNFGGRLW